MLPNEIFEKVAKAYEEKRPFVLYSLPRTNSLNILVQQNSKTFKSTSFEDKGFYMAPFNFQEDTHIIPFSESEAYHTEVDENLMPLRIIENSNSNDGEKNIHVNLVNKAIENIKTSKNSKIVISRKKEIKLRKFDLNKLLNNLLSANSDAFRYVWYHPTTDLWCGASPEILIAKTGNDFATMSLAGTQKIVGNTEVNWGRKEIEEQLLVTNSIIKNLSGILVEKLSISKPYNQNAGSLVHLRTDITGTINKTQSSLSAIIKAIHPTPAICGLELESAKEFILKNESYNREFYTGFMGLVGHKNENALLYVNLRCMKIENKVAHIYVGGGITASSIAESEWVETQNKMQTMLQLLRDII